MMSADFLAGYISGAAGIVVGNPLDLIKVRVQASSLVSLPSTSGSVITTLHSARTLFNGLPAPIITYGALNAVLFATYNRTLLIAARFDPSFQESNSLSNLDWKKTYPYWNHFFAGCIGGFATFFISVPTELIKCRAQVSLDANPRGVGASSWSIARSIYGRQGLQGFYRGGCITTVRDGIGYGFYFASYEASKDLWDWAILGLSPPRIGLDSNASCVSNTMLDVIKVLLCGGLAGVVTWTSVFPLDVVKTRLQTQIQDRLTPVPPFAPPSPTIDAASPLINRYCTRYPHNAMIDTSTSIDRNGSRCGAWTIAKHAYRTEGLSVFFRGWLICSVRAFIVNAVQWTVYEWTMARLLG